MSAGDTADTTQAGGDGADTAGLNADQRSAAGPRTRPLDATATVRVGIVGAGKLGISLARLARSAGDAVTLLGSGRQKHLANVLAFTAPGAGLAATFPELAENSDVIVLALPSGAVDELDLDAVQAASAQDGRERLVIDATNAWEPGALDGDGGEDGDDGEPLWDRLLTPSSAPVPTAKPRPPISAHTSALHARYPGVNIAKTLNHVAYQDLEPHAWRAPSRRAIGVVASNPRAEQLAADFVYSLGYAPTVLGGLGRERLLEPDGPIFGKVLSEPEFREECSHER